ncbi:hypothetical protein AKJ16_DCAP17566 [Drosera capensis]
MVQRKIGTHGKIFQINKKPTAAEPEVPRKQTRLVQRKDRYLPAGEGERDERRSSRRAVAVHRRSPRQRRRTLSRRRRRDQTPYFSPSSSPSSLISSQALDLQPSDLTKLFQETYDELNKPLLVQTTMDIFNIKGSWCPNLTGKREHCKSVDEHSKPTVNHRHSTPSVLQTHTV